MSQTSVVRIFGKLSRTGKRVGRGCVDCGITICKSLSDEGHGRTRCENACSRSGDKKHASPL